MKDLCRICRTRLIGNQCRWIFSSSAKNKLQVILSHVLRKEVTRDGRGEFLCGKCVFQLEKVVRCDVDISHIQEDNNRQIQRLQAEKDHLIQCIVHVYNKNNSDLDKDDGETNCSKSNFMTSAPASPDDENMMQLTTNDLQYQDKGVTPAKKYIRRCVSLDRIGGRGSLRGTRHRSQSMYFDLVQRKGPHIRHGFKGSPRQSLKRDFSSVISSECLFKVKGVSRLSRTNSSTDTFGKTQASLLVQSTSAQPSIISDFIQLLCCICTRKLSVPAGSHIPVLRGNSSNPIHPCSNHSLKDNKWKTLRQLTDEFDDEYFPVIVKVV